jgi:ankyrin repeat protein
LWEILDYGETYFQKEWYSSSKYSWSRASTGPDASNTSYNADYCEQNGDKPGLASEVDSEITTYFGTFDLSHLQELSQLALQRACPERSFQRSYLGPLLRLTLHPEPNARISRLWKSPIMNQWSLAAPTNALQAKLAIHTRTSELGYDMFRPERQEDIRWEHQVQIFEDFQTVAKNERQGTRLASACFQSMICYTVGFGCKIDHARANQNLRRAIENELSVAHLFGDNLAAGFTGLSHRTDQTDHTFASKLRDGFANQRSIDKTSTLSLCWGREHDAIGRKTSLSLTAFAPFSALLEGASKIAGVAKEVILEDTHLYIEPQHLVVSWLEFAILTNDMDLLRLCCESLHTSSMSLIGAWDETPLLLACRLGRGEMVRTLLSAGANGLQTATCNILHWLFCLAEDAINCLDLAAKRFPDLYAMVGQLCMATYVLHSQWPTELSGTPLAFAVITGSRSLVYHLLRAGADPLAPALPPTGDDEVSEWTAVHLAIKYNHVEIMHDLLIHLKESRLQTDVTYLQFSKLQLAAALSFLTPVERFGIHGLNSATRLGQTIQALPLASLFWQSSRGATPLWQAIDFENFETVAALLDHHPRLAEVEIKDPNNSTSRMLPLHFAAQICARRGSSDALRIPQRILAAFPKALSRPDDKGRTALHFSVIANFTEVTQFLVSQGAQVNILDELKRSPLMFCRSVDNTTVLLQKNANILLVDNEGMNAAHHAVAKGDESQLQLLIKNGVEIDAMDQDMGTPLHYSVSSSSRTRIEMLLKAHARVNAVNKYGDTALHVAVRSNRIDAVRLLMQYGADPSIGNNSGLTPLTIAIKQGLLIHDFPIKVSRQLFEALLDVEAASLESKDGRQRLIETQHLCAREGNQELMRAFLSHPQVRGVISRDAELRGMTPLHAAAEFASAGTAHALLAAGADPNKRNAAGATPLITLCACEEDVDRGGRIAFLKALHSHGADITASDKRGRTAWKLAHKQQDFAMMTALLRCARDQRELVQKSLVTLEMVNVALSLGNKDFVDTCLSNDAASLRFLHEEKTRKKIATSAQCENTVPAVAKSLRYLLSTDIRMAELAFNGQYAYPRRLPKENDEFQSLISKEERAILEAASLGRKRKIINNTTIIK